MRAKEATHREVVGRYKGMERADRCHFKSTPGVQTSSIMSTKVNPDLASVRAQATFDPLELTHYLYGGPEKVKRKRYLQNLAIQEYKRQGCKDFTDLSRDEQYTEAMHKITVIYRKLKELGIMQNITETHYFREPFLGDSPDPTELHTSMFCDTLTMQATKEQRDKWIPLAENYAIVGTAFIREPADLTGLHRSMFSDTLSRLGTKEQKHKWIPLAQNFAILGTYAQTELGHDRILGIPLIRLDFTGACSLTRSADWEPRSRNTSGSLLPRTLLYWAHMLRLS
ncbi:peroxisomal acyl-coenzyme A oxidase 1 [Elysia marginata]|uniref:Peroxisomal acyl-coenzyme A oxidase 1 n=1 Tax=Elysia marginata TaxID=1093978 RepID=A0AAV4JC44_9GAST|nr:peroxisomal acyl-coenzyme A oxidase 1 [Elysia marginata]